MSGRRFAGLTLAFNLFWTLAVSLRDAATIPLLLLALLAWLCSPPARRIPLLLLAALGVAMDGLWLRCGLFSFNSSATFPAWMLALWLAFACWWPLFLQRYRLGWPWLMGLGALSGPFSYYLGERLGAMQLHQPGWQVFTLLAVGWALLLPASRKLIPGT
ncbi:DUF2878 domain-containing protein [Erwinia sp. B116]|uniref:DUF2878 domain-containing protein n=1 Tax=Erwinia sp. B116 TaxID=1561024 RepID=UPI000C782C90|nr:DUF2878 domain-containing protein [Erwinia sp. B116]PLV60687.1 hypothetical protein NV64_12180 [Erwinia sp. B116]